MERLAWGVGLCWAVCGVLAAFANGKPGLWRVTIWLGPIAFFLLPKNHG